MVKDRFDEDVVREVVKEDVKVCKCGSAGNGGRNLQCKIHGNKNWTKNEQTENNVYN